MVRTVMLNSSGWCDHSFCPFLVDDDRIYIKCGGSATAHFQTTHNSIITTTTAVEKIVVESAIRNVQENQEGNGSEWNASASGLR